ncbi:MAG: hypothetical protein ISS34_06445 [Candidatus Omnitrophica bacterium]|nr:hypothetical protein [Candidatus Omnitrophota bacterium]
MGLDKVLKNKIYHTILKFFHENPNSIDTPRGVATWTNQDIKKVRVSLKRLEKLGLLIDHRVSSTTGYSLTRNKKKIAEISSLLETEE